MKEILLPYPPNTQNGAGNLECHVSYGGIEQGVAKSGLLGDIPHIPTMQKSIRWRIGMKADT